MMETDPTSPYESYVKARDLKVVVKFERDESPEGIIRSKRVKELICQFILLGMKRGRPSKQEESLDEVA